MSELPAVAGGTKAKTVPYQQKNRYGKEELKELKEALEQGTLFYSLGKKVKALEEAVASFTGAQYAVATSSGTASIHAALAALGVGAGDEVITVPITDFGAIAPILFQGAIPVFADLHPNYYSLTAETVKACLSAKTKAILTVHLGGNPCAVEELKAFADSKGLPLIEDCAQAWGSRINGKHVGTIGTIGCFSLNEFKQISAGDAGIVVSNDSEIARRLRAATDKSYDRSPNASSRNPIFLATNYRMTELQGAVGLAQIRKLDKIVKARRKYGNGLLSAFKKIPGIMPPLVLPGSEPNWWFMQIRVDEKKLGVSTDEFARIMAAEGISCSAHYIGMPVYQYPVMQTAQGCPNPAQRDVKYPKGLCPIAEKILATCVNFPVNDRFSSQDLAETKAGILKVGRWLSEKK